MRIVVFTPEIPFPPIHGGRLDVWNRVLSLAQLGHKLLLIIGVNDINGISDSVKENLFKYFEDFIFYQKRRKVTNYLQLKYPPYSVAYHINDSDKEDFVKKISSFNPDFIWMESWGMYLMVKELNKYLKKKIIYRSHNVEYNYFFNQFYLAKGLIKLRILFNAILLKKFEINIRTNSQIIFDISKEDRTYWLQNNYSFKNNFILPYLFIENNNLENKNEENFDLAFIGNLWSPNNVDGILWFIKKVLPIIKKKINKEIKVGLIGSNPLSKVEKIAKKNNIIIIKNVDNIIKFYKNSKILINPIKFTSGINIKMVEMLFYGNFIISTSKVLRGIPTELQKFIFICDSHIDFANTCIDVLTNDTDFTINKTKKRELIDKYFGINNLTDSLKLIKYIKI